MAARPSRPTKRTTRRPSRAANRDRDLENFDFEDSGDAREARQASDEVADRSDVVAEAGDFGDDIVDEPSPRKSRRAAEVAVEKEDEPVRETREPAAEVHRDSDTQDSHDSFEPDEPVDDGGEPAGTGEATADGEARPERRRRRRRRRRPGEQNDMPQAPQQNRGNRPQQRPFQQRGPHQNRGPQGRQQQQQQPRRAKYQQNAPAPEPGVTSGTITGVLELHPKGYGFLRDAGNDYGARETDPFVSSTFVEKHQLREGIMITGEIGPGTRGQGPRLLSIATIDGGSVEDYEKVKHFDTLTAINPYEQIKLETGPQPVTMRVMDLLTPVGKGQRALIVAPPRSGKTMLLHDIANAVSQNHPEIHLIVLLIDERPEEVTEMRRTVRGEVIASSMDRDVESHVRISQLIIERGKRLAESGKDCFILLDSITRTARAFNKWVGNSGRTGTGGLDVKALEVPRKMFGTARLFDEGGSLTIAATALIDTGSRMDEAIFQEFKGTGNMEMVLSRDLADRRIWPSIDISKSGTRREEKILAPEILDGITMLRRALVSMSPVEAMTELTRKLAMFKSNAEFLERVRSVL